jgi:sulfur carrier protein ThiS
MMTISLIDRLNNMSAERRSYNLQTLTQHLYKAEQCEHLHALLTYDWMRVLVEDNGQYVHKEDWYKRPLRSGKFERSPCLSTVSEKR